MAEYKCPHCGSENPPVNKSIWNTKDKVIAFFLFVLFFPLGIGYFIYKSSSNKEQVCPDCKKAYSGAQGSTSTEDIAKIATVVKAVANDPAAKQSFRELKESVKDLQDTFYVN